MIPFSFIHAADLHLDSQFKGLLKSDIADSILERIRNATFKAFDTIVDLCLQEMVDFIVIAGDVFNTDDYNLGAQIRFRNGMRRLDEANIKAFIVTGNHDPLVSWSSKLELPDNTFIFKENIDSKIFCKEGVPCAAIHGISYPKRDIRTNLAKQFKLLTENDIATSEILRHDFDSENVDISDLFQIGLLHCSVGSHAEHEPYAPCSLKQDLIPSGLDYWALGHVHTQGVLHEHNPYVVYPGNIQGLHSNETGARGCYVVSVSEHAEVDLTFVPVDDVRWYKEEIRIDNLFTIDDLEKTVDTFFEGCRNESGMRLSIARLSLTGRGELHELLKQPEDAADLFERFHINGLQLDPPVFLSALDIQTRKNIDIETRRNVDDSIGDFLKIVEKTRNSPDLLQSLYIQLNDLYSNSRARRFLGKPDEESLQSLISEAESLCVDLLIGDED